MSEKNADTTLDEKRLPFSWVDRFLKPISKLAGWVRGLQTRPVEIVFWLLALFALVPAIRAELLSPSHWLQGIGLDYTIAWIEQLFSLITKEWSLKELPDIVRVLIVGALVLLPVFALFVIAVARRRYLLLIALLPYFTIMLPYLAMVLIDNKSSAWWFTWANSVYVVSAFVVFLYFIIDGKVRSLYFFLFVVFLSVLKLVDSLLVWHHIIEFVAASLVLSLIYETARQNWPLLKQLGRHGALVLLRRTFSLWSPTLLLIAAGLWISQQITSGTEQMFYEKDVVTPYCLFHEARPTPQPVGELESLREKQQTILYIRCPQKGTVLTRDEITVINNDPEPDWCALSSEAEQRRKRFTPRLISFVCPADYHQVDGKHVYKLSRAPFFVSLDQTVVDRFRITQEKLNVAKNMFQDARFRDPVLVGREARRMFSFVPHDTGLIEQSCAFADVECCVANLVKSTLNDAYGDIRSRAERRFVANAVTRANEGNLKVNQAVNAAKKELDQSLKILQQQTRKTVNDIYQTSKVIQILLMAWLIIIAIKSFLYVFSRVIFDKSTDIHVDLLEQETDAKEGVVKHMQEITIPGNYPYDLYYKCNYQPLGPAPRFSIPQWRSSLLSRIRFGAWNMNRVDMPLDNDRGVTFNAIEAEYLVDWHMEEGEEIIFSYGNFVAMNENVELRTVISLRVATMLMGRFIFHTARCKNGSGRLILRTRGKPATAEQVRQSIPSSRLIAWNRYARFSVDSHLTRSDIFLNGFNLRRSDVDDDGRPQGIIVVEADARSGGIMIGTLRFAKHFLLPV